MYLPGYLKVTPKRYTQIILDASLPMGNSCFGTFHRVLLAERVGFEPTVRFHRTPDFESGTFDHSATSPRKPAMLADSKVVLLCSDGIPILFGTATDSNPKLLKV